MCGSRSGSKNDDSREQKQITRAEERALHVCCIVTEARARFAPDVRIGPEIGGPKPVQGSCCQGAWEQELLVSPDPSGPLQKRDRILRPKAPCSLHLWPCANKSGSAPGYPLPRTTLRAENRIGPGHPRSGPAESTRSSSCCARKVADPELALDGTRRWPAHIFCRQSRHSRGCCGGRPCHCE